MPKILDSDPCDSAGDLQTDLAPSGLETDANKTVATIDDASLDADSARMKQHRNICELLRLDADLVSPDELGQATLTNDDLRQATLLAWLFKACGVGHPILKADRSHIVKTIAADKPQTEAERDALYNAQIARSLFFLSASHAHDDKDRAAIHVRNCIELEELSVHLRERFEASRAQHIAKQTRGQVTAPRVKSIGHKK